MMKVLSKTLFTAAAILFCAGFTGCKCCADEKKRATPKMMRSATLATAPSCW